MAKLILILAAQIILLGATVTSTGKNDEEFGRTINRKHLGLGKKRETHTYPCLLARHFKWYLSPSSIRIQQPVSKYSSSSFFGSITMIDNALTLDVPINSTVVGQAQGMYAGAAQKELGFLMAMNLAFKTGKYNGSTITILGRNTVLSKVREMPVVGALEVVECSGSLEVMSRLGPNGLILRLVTLLLSITVISCIIDGAKKSTHLI